MKLIFGLALLLAAASTWAQLPPAPAPPRAAERIFAGSVDQAPRGIEKPLPKQVPLGLDKTMLQVPHGIEKAPPQATQPSNAELSDLLRKQTAAIKALHGQLTELEGRIGKLERGAR